MNRMAEEVYMHRMTVQVWGNSGDKESENAKE